MDFINKVQVKRILNHYCVIIAPIRYHYPPDHIWSQMKQTKDFARKHTIPRIIRARSALYRLHGEATMLLHWGCTI